jgi:hypothetical protein
VGELAVKEREWELAWEDYLKQYAAWREQVNIVLAAGEAEWGKALGKLNEGYNGYRKDFLDEYEAKSTAWEAGWLEFTLEKQGWIEEQYLYAAGVGASGAAEQGGLSAEEAIGRVMAAGKQEGIKREAINSGEYVATLLSGTGLEELMRYGAALGARGKNGAGLARRGV